MLLIMVLSTTASAAQQAVVLSAWVERALYCKQSNNQPVFQLFVGFTYENTGNRPLIIPRFGILAGYEAVEHRQEKILRNEVSFKELEIVSQEIWKGSFPDPGWFVVVPPGQAFRAGTRIQVLPVFHKPEDGSSLHPAGQYSIRLAMDHGARRAEKLPDSEHWRDIGLLLRESIDATVITIQVPSAEPSIACPEPPLLTVHRLK